MTYEPNWDTDNELSGLVCQSPIGWCHRDDLEVEQII